MAVNLSPVGGVAAQFFTNTGAVLTGGKLFTYAAGTTTPQTTFTSGNGATPWTNPIVLDAAGRVPSSGEIWLTDGISYKFVLKDSTDVLIATYDNITGINSNFVNFVAEQEIQTATAGQTVFTLTTTEYQPGTNTLSVFVDGVNQYGPGAQYAYTETSSTVVTFVSGLHVGASVKFTTSQTLSGGTLDSSQIVYDPPFSGSVETTVEDKLAQTVSVMDFMTSAQIASVQAADLVEDVTAAIQAAIDYISAKPTRGSVYFPPGKYYVATGVTVSANGVWLKGDAMFSARIVGLPSGTADLVKFGPLTGLPSGVVDLGIAFEGGNSTYNCLTLDNCNGTFLNRVWVNGGKRGFNLITGTDDCQLTDCVAEECIESNFYLTGAHSVKLLNCLSYACQVNGLQMDTGPAVGVDHARPIQVSNFTDTNSQNFGVAVTDYTDICFENVSVVSAGSIDRPNGGFSLDNCTRVVMSNVTVSHTEFIGIQVNDSTSISITNPMIDRVGDYVSVPTAAYYGILVDNSTVSILGGAVTDVAGYGIRFAGGSDGKVIGTDIINPCQNGDAVNGLWALYVSDGSPNIVINGVDVIGNNVASTIGFYVDTTATLRFSNNYITGFPTLYAQSGGFVPKHLSNNAGVVTENSGVATIPSGSTSIIVTHGMSFTPSDKDISITFLEQGTADYGRWWVNNINSTQFRINVTNDPGVSGLDIGWRIQVLN